MVSTVQEIGEISESVKKGKTAVKFMKDKMANNILKVVKLY